MNKIRRFLESKLDNADELHQKVIRYFLDNDDDDIKSSMEEVETYGCESGSVGFLVYTNECKDFFILYENNIEDLMKKRGSCFTALTSLIENKEVNSFDMLFTSLSWFAVEEVTDELLSDYENCEFEFDDDDDEEEEEEDDD